MTALNSAILFNSTSGSDTTASGSSAGANVYGSGAATTSGSAVVTGITTTGGVQAGDLLWVQSSSGRQFSVIASVGSGQVTCDDTFANTESSRSWAIGGKRATFDNTDSRRLFNEDCKSDFVLETETDQTITSDIVCSNISPNPTVKGSSSSLHSVITQSSNDFHFSGGVPFEFQNLKFQNTNATKTSADAIRLSGSVSSIRFVNCIFGDSTNQLRTALHRSSSAQPFVDFMDCFITNCTSHGISTLFGSGGRLSMTNCYIGNNGTYGIFHQYGGGANCIISNSIIVDNNSHGIAFGSSQMSAKPFITDCTIANNGGDGINCGSGVGREITCLGSSITGNSGYGINIGGTSPEEYVRLIQRNNFGTGSSANTSGATNLSPAVPSENDELDPEYADAANKDYAVGANLKYTGYPDSSRTIGANQSNTNTYKVCGASQDNCSGAGGGATIHPLYAN